MIVFILHHCIFFIVIILNRLLVTAIATDCYPAYHTDTSTKVLLNTTDQEEMKGFWLVENQTDKTKLITKNTTVATDI